MIEKRIPQRMCVGCQQMKDKSGLMRVVRTEKDGVVPDATGRMNGRGAYICKSAECVEKARKTRKLSKAFGMQVSDAVYTELAEWIAKEKCRAD